uniref:cysteine dioxygenase n=1 Tax=Oryza punctata TaxID=4537 RepID=A0A0E0KGY9_ORYPU
MEGSASFPVVAVDSALRPEAVEGQGAAATATAATAAPKTLIESESSASASIEPEEQEAEPGKKRKREPADVGSPSMDGTDGQRSGGDDEEDDGEEAPMVVVPQAVSPPRQNALQRLVDECRVLLDGSESTPPPNTVSSIVALLIPMHALTLLQVAVFYLPAGTVMPLHDHPGMTVFSKLLAGSVHVQSFDWVSPSVYGGAGGKRAVRSSNTKLVNKVLDHVVEAGCGTWVLYPSTGGNLHRFVAGVDEPCAFLDVLTPPYSEDSRRRCTFYREYPFELHRNHKFGSNLSDEEKSQFSWLRPISGSVPPDLQIVPLTYSGPPVV